MKMLTKAVAALGLVLLGASARADYIDVNPVDVEVWAQMDSTLQLTVVGSTSYDLGAFTSNEVKLTATSYEIRNTSPGLSVNLNLAASVVGGWTLHTGAGVPGAADQVAVDAIFNGGTTPAPAEFDDLNTNGDRLTGVSRAADASNFTDGTQNGLSVPVYAVAGDERDLYLKVTAPPTSTTTAKQRIQVDILATP